MLPPSSPHSASPRLGRLSPLSSPDSEARRQTGGFREKAKVLVVDDDPSVRRIFGRILVVQGHEVSFAESASSATDAVSRERFDVVVLDMNLPDRSGLDLLAELTEGADAPEIILVTAFGTVETAVEAMRRGAFDYLSKPLTPEGLGEAVGRAAEMHRAHRESTARQRMMEQVPFTGPVISESPLMRDLLRKIETIAPAQAAVLLTGESGTGKGLMAKTVHQLSRRARAPFVQINCGALQESLVESELFGYRKGAFTGATESRAGLFEVADGGTLFLDEIGEMSPTMQAKLLQVLDSGEIRPVGSTTVRKVDVRIVAATNRDLAAEVAAGRFRQDLFFRLNVIHIHLPPLRERREDIASLVSYYAQRFHPVGRPRRQFSEEAMTILRSYDWPGNVRELANTVETAVLLARSELIQPDELTLPYSAAASTQRTKPDPSKPPVSLSEAERQHILHTLEFTGGLKARAARLLEIDIKTLNRKLKTYRIKEH